MTRRRDGAAEVGRRLRDQTGGRGGPDPPPSVALDEVTSRALATHRERQRAERLVVLGANEGAEYVFTRPEPVPFLGSP